MLTALQAQLELGDCGSFDVDYRTIASHCLPSRLVPNLPQEGIMLHYQSLRGMTSPEAKKAFLNLIRSWPFHRATIFDVMVRFKRHLFRSKLVNLKNKVANFISYHFLYTSFAGTGKYVYYFQINIFWQMKTKMMEAN